MSDFDFQDLIEKAKAEILSYYASKKEFIDYDKLKEKLGVDDDIFCKLLKALAEPQEEVKEETQE